MPSKSSLSPVAAVLAVVALLIIAVITYLTLRDSPETPVAVSVENPAPPSEQVAPDASVVPEPAPLPERPSPDEASAEGQPRETMAPTPRPTLYPEEQPRTFFVANFDEGNPPDSTFDLLGIESTDEGLVLSDSAPTEDGVRYGILESPPQVFDFPVNSIAPLWKETLPDGTEVSMEIAVSGDGNDWSEWYEFHADKMEIEGEIEPYYPDGRPNPNYGYTQGGLLVFGTEEMKDFFKYRVYMTSESDANPVFSGLRIFCQDSTLVDRSQ